MSENRKLSLFEGIALLAGVLALVFLSLPCYIESSGVSLTGFQVIFGNERTDFSGILFLGFLLLVLGIVLSLGYTVFLFLKKENNPKITTIVGILQILFFLAGSILLACSILITGLDKANSELGLIQGNWFIGASNYLVLIFGLIASAMSYPCALVILHHKDVEDRTKKGA